MWKPHSYNFGPPILASTINKQIMFFQTPLGPHFSYFMLIFSKHAHFGDPFKIKWVSKLAQVDQVAPKWHHDLKDEALLRVSETKFFHESISIDLLMFFVDV